MKIVNYVKESYNELVHKVSWPSVGELRSSAIVVMVASLIFALVIMSMDLAFENAMKGLYRMLYN